MRNTYFPATDGDLLIWGANFADQLARRAGHFGATAAQVADLVAANDAYAEAFGRAGEPATRTRGAVAARNDARGALKVVVRRVVSVVRGQAGVTAEELVNIGLPAHPRRPVALPAPQDAPGLAVVSASGHAVRLRLRDRSGERYGRPRGAAGAVVFSHVGPTPPTGRAGWTFEATLAGRSMEVRFDPAVPAGSTVWFTAHWVNPRLQPGPPATPVGTNLPGTLAWAA